MILDYITSNWMEATGTLLSLIYLYLSIKERISLWVFGFLSSAFYIFVFYETKFYADMSLQVYYLIISAYGWYNWNKGHLKNESELKITNVSKKIGLKLALLSIPIFGIYYLILSKFTDSPIPISDSIVGMLSVIATWMLAKKIIENWVLWIAADALATILFYNKGLYITCVLFLIYTVMALIGYLQWKKKLVL